MTKKEASDYIRGNPFIYLKEAKKKNTYICPLCGNGTGSQGDGMTTKDGKHFSCWKCNEIKNADILDIIGKEYGATEYGEKLEKAIELYGLIIDDGPAPIKKPGPKTEAQKSNDKPRQDLKEKAIEEPKEAPRADYSKVIEKGQREIKKSPEAIIYLRDRGFTIETIEKWRLGLVERNGKQYILIPYSNNYYILRGLKEKEYRKPKSSDAGKEPLFNAEALESKGPVFIVESALCAISIEQCGGRAVALGTTGAPGSLDDAINTRPYKGLFILSLDNDDAGKKGQERLEERLNEKGIKYIAYNIADGLKDPNELLQKNPEALEANIKKAIEEATATEYGDILENNIDVYANHYFLKDIDAFKVGQSIKTGFTSWDNATGGLYNGLYFIGAISSLGKTTLMHQLADQLAKQGNNVLFFSLEQSKLELMSKSLSREIYKKGIFKADSLSIRKGEINGLEEYINAYAEAVKDHLNIIEGSTETDINFIRSYTEKYINLTEKRPVVIIDYLQIIENTREKDPRAKVESNVKALKLLSRDFKIPVLCISNINRSNYNLPVDFESFKETGLIEYSADVILGLQLEIITSQKFIKCDSKTAEREEIKKAFTATPRNIKLVCLKNRYGARYEIDFNYYPRYDYIEEATETIINPFTGETATLDPFNAKLYP